MTPELCVDGVPQLRLGERLHHVAHKTVDGNLNISGSVTADDQDGQVRFERAQPPMGTSGRVSATGGGGCVPRREVSESRGTQRQWRFNMTQDLTAKPLSRDLILGSWRMTSWVTRDVATGERRDALGPNPRGIGVYTPERVAFLVVKNDRPRPEQVPPSDREKIALFDTMFAYSGRYTVATDRVIHHVDLSWSEAWTGDQVRFGRLDGDTLTLTSPPSTSPFDGREIVHEVTFEREK